MRRADECSILQISSLPCFSRWGASRCKHSSREQVSQEENWFDIKWKCEVAHIPRLIPPACCVYFQISRDGADSCSTALESRWRSPCHRRCLLLGCLRFVCTLKWWNRPEIYFLPGFDLIFSDIGALICSGLGCSGINWRSWISERVSCDFVSRSKVTLNKPRLSGGGGSTCFWQLRRFCFMLANEKHIFLPGVCLPHHPDTHDTLIHLQLWSTR